jgi:Multiple myeloma tumor-associated
MLQNMGCPCISDPIFIFFLICLGKDLFWYTRDKNGANSSEALKEEVRRVKEEEEQAMREALGLAPKRAKRSHGNRLDKHEYAELVKRGSTAEDLGAGHAEAAQVQGLGLYKYIFFL